MLYSAKDVHDLNAELQFRVMIEESKTLTPGEWINCLTENDFIRLKRAATLRNGGACLVQADVSLPGEYDSPIVEDAYEPNVFLAILHKDRPSHKKGLQDSV